MRVLNGVWIDDATLARLVAYETERDHAQTRSLAKARANGRLRPCPDCGQDGWHGQPCLVCMARNDARMLADAIATDRAVLRDGEPVMCACTGTSFIARSDDGVARCTFCRVVWSP